MIIIGIICLILGYVFGIGLLETLGLVLLLIGLLLWAFGFVGGHTIGGRRHWW